MIPVDSFRTRINGPVIEPFDPDYNDARTVFVAGIDRLPSLVMGPADATDVGAAIGLARENDLELAARSGATPLPLSGSRTVASSSTSVIAIDTKHPTKGDRNGSK